MRTILLLTFSLLILGAYTKTAEEWKSRVIYQIITDRFSRSNNDNSACTDLGKYCGGTFKGIQNNLDYIQDAGFNAIWISPVVENTENGYHGYWTKNLYNINEHFGTEQDLKDLINACHERDIWVMVDIIANHVGYAPVPDFSSITPFNDPSHYNPSVSCDDVPSWDKDAFEKCWLAGLPDLNQENPFVRKTLLEWISNTVQEYGFDGIRLDALRHVSRSFWSEFSQAAGVFTIGEVFDYDIPYLASYQGSVDSLLNFPFYSTMRYVFEKHGSMSTFEGYYGGATATWKDITVLGNFVDNHDIPRFLDNNPDVAGFKSALGFSMCSVGIPTVYYGDEQGFGGGADPGNREALWNNMDRDNEFYKFVKQINTFRKNSAFWKNEQVQRYSDDSFYSFSRGEHMFAFTNKLETQTRTITYHSYTEGTSLCNVFHPKDCVQVKDGKFDITLLAGEMKILSPMINNQNEPALGSWQKIKAAFADGVSLNIARMSSYTRVSQ